MIISQPPSKTRLSSSSSSSRPQSTPKRPDLTVSNVRDFLVSLSSLTHDNFCFSSLVHGANGYLITQFLDSTANQRTDIWGGSPENRSRFGLEVLKVLTEVFCPDVGVKLSPAGGYNDVG
jgi:hypothetical protein